MAVTNKPSINRGVTVVGWYYSDLMTDTFELPIRWPGVTSCTTKDTSILIDSCASVDNTLVISITKK